MVMNVVVKTDLPLKIFKKGKVRDVYEVDDKLLLVATDRISAFDHVLHEPIPNKGICLTQISRFWFEYFRDIVPNHMISADVSKYPDELQKFGDILNGRSMLVKKADVFPIECIVRGYLSGSGWRSYQKTGEICGIKLPPGLKESQKLDEPLFTPSTKAESGHDVNISFEKMKKLIGDEYAERLKELSLKMYNRGTEYACEKGIIIADTKFEFGKIDDEIIVVDELLTPDSSRFWPADLYEPGRSQPSFDKQYVRDYLVSTGWDKNSSPPHLPGDVILETQKKYQEAYERITGEKFMF
ncbi:MAG: phosphoribosylaminoimidazolesuccinocarboxamide synthase [Thermoplasmata archaeon]|nr:MAG: phosphoribosylaminoimidazolesuccinocarboxamide synthase [Thermoplasmata archaeon]RLF30977.1 MAG: phosphoribosylaminoimidazolesuccinocarboxamide synthase [Thermoplasmata archaeon]RLF53259.1 MAG: phosphoribosylaminoimidazolesuccinocarboxamide synthase [Thermoplasmata archaeon]